MKELSLNIQAERLTHAPTQWPSLGLAALVHIGLLAFLWIGVQWQSKTPMVVEAEVWDMTAREAAPLPVLEELRPVEQVTPPPVKVVQDETPVEDPEIVLKQEKKRLAEQKKEEARELKQKEELAEKKKKAEEKKIEELAKLEEKKKLADKADNKAQDKKEKLLADKLFAENMRRFAGQATTAVGSGGIGDAAKSTGNNRGDPSYAAKVASMVRSKMASAVSDNSSNNPTVEYRLDLLPDGSLRGAVKKMKSSGVSRFDDDVENAIRSAAPFPKDKSGVVPPSIDLVYRLKD